VELCHLVGSSSVKLLYDIYHMQVMEGDVIRTIRENIASIGHFHTAGNPGRKNLDDQQELYYPAICRAIRETDFVGFIGQEFGPKGDAEHALREAFAACNH
jgi:hydroxypyruvate isomerase